MHFFFLLIKRFKPSEKLQEWQFFLKSIKHAIVVIFSSLPNLNRGATVGEDMGDRLSHHCSGLISTLSKIRNLPQQTFLKHIFLESETYWGCSSSYTRNANRFKLRQFHKIGSFFMSNFRRLWMDQILSKKRNS